MLAHIIAVLAVLSLPAGAMSPIAAGTDIVSPAGAPRSDRQLVQTVTCEPEIVTDDACQPSRRAEVKKCYDESTKSCVPCGRMCLP